MATPNDQDFLMQFFAYSHLPADKQEVSKPFGELAEKVMKLPRNPERTVALRKLLEAKDCAVRCLVAEQNRIMAETLERASKPAGG
jgi:S-adenosylhomocysteine hydrolase